MHRRTPHDPPLPDSPDSFDEPAAREPHRAPHGPPPGLALDPPDAPPLSHDPEIPVERLDADAIKVIARLRHMGHKAYFVGGCVRDLLLGAKPKDFDVATDAHPGEVRAIFRNCRLIGRRFRLAHVYFRGGKVIEVATFRKNPIDVAEDVEDGADLLITRDNVFGTAEEDAVRRDFTVNGLFYDVASGEVIDYVGGRADLEARRIATIGDPEVRIREDPVRSLRAVRFAARLGFIIAPDTFEAMRRHAGELARCAPPRVLEEVFKILRCGGSARAFELLRASGALPVVLPALGAFLESWDDARRRSFYAHLAALDRLVRAGEDVSEAVLLGALLMHLAPIASGARPGPAAAPPASAAPPAEGAPDLAAPARAHERPGAAHEAEALLASLVQTSRLPRKIAERTKLALMSQRNLRDPRKRRRRGRGAGGQYQADSLQLLRITVDATGEGQELLERWESQGHGPGEGQGGGHDARGGHRHHAGGQGHGRVPEERDEAALEVAVEAGDEAGDEGAVPAEADAVPAGGQDAGQDAAVRADGQPGGRRRRRRRGGRRRRRRGAAAPPVA